MSPYARHQQSAYRELSRYGEIKEKAILEVGGSQSCKSAEPFLQGGARRVVVTGLGHISEPGSESRSGLEIMQVDALSLSQRFQPESFDMVYGVSIVEHIPCPDRFLEEVHAVLKPGGICYFQGGPLWSSRDGHHLWVSKAVHGSTANYFFKLWRGMDSSNPLPGWAHLLMNPDEMEEGLRVQGIPEQDMELILDWVYRSDQINRLSFLEIAKAYTQSRLCVLEAGIQRVPVPNEIRERLFKRYGEMDYGVASVAYVMKKLN